MKDGEFSVKIKTKEDGFENEIKIKSSTDGIGITWKKILISTIDALKGLGYSFSDETMDKLIDVTGLDERA